MSDPVYQPPILNATAQRNFTVGPGEGLPLNPISLHFEGVIRVEGTLIKCVIQSLCCRSTDGHHSASPRRHYILFSTKNPPAIQRIPWPSEADEPEQVNDEERGPREGTHFGSYDTWVFNDREFDWFLEPDGEHRDAHEISQTNN